MQQKNYIPRGLLKSIQKNPIPIKKNTQKYIKNPYSLIKKPI